MLTDGRPEAGPEAIHHARHHAGLIDSVIAKLSTAKYAPTETSAIRHFSQSHATGESGTAYWPPMLTVIDALSHADTMRKTITQELLDRGCLVLCIGDQMRAGRDEHRWNMNVCIARREMDAEHNHTDHRCQPDCRSDNHNLGPVESTSYDE